MYPSSYSFTCGLPQVVGVGTRRAISILGRLELLDDAGNVICVREVPGGAEIQFLEGSPDRPASDLKTFINAAKSNAFVNAWLCMGLATSVDLKFKNKGTSEKASVEVVFTSNLSFSSKGKPLVFGDATINGEKVVFKIFQEGLEFFTKNNKAGKVLSVNEVAKCFTENYGVGKAKTSILCKGYFSEYKGVKQFVLQEGV